MFLIFPLEVVQTLFQVLCFLFNKTELLVLGVLKKFMKTGHLSLLAQNCFLSFFVVDKAFLSNFLEFLQLSFGLSSKSTHEIGCSKVTR